MDHCKALALRGSRLLNLLQGEGGMSGLCQVTYLILDTDSSAEAVQAFHDEIGALWVGNQTWQHVREVEILD